MKLTRGILAQKGRPYVIWLGIIGLIDLKTFVPGNKYVGEKESEFDKDFS